ncbi:MAG: hypothetical protein M3Q40_08480 [Pseudomonadota bacterium]|nr:hypothetical protein [Pseudomonadota bacterium]
MFQQMSVLATVAILASGCSVWDRNREVPVTQKQHAVASAVDPQVLNACYVQCNKDHDACRSYAVSPEARTDCARVYNECRRNCE